MHDPAGAIEVVHERLRHVVAAQPVEAILHAELPFEFGVFGFARAEPVGRAQPLLANGDNVADRAVVDAFYGFLIAFMKAALKAGDD